MTGTTTLILLKVASIEKLRRLLRLLMLRVHVRHGLWGVSLRRQEHFHLLWRHHGHLLGMRLHLVMRVEAKVVWCLLLWLHWHSVHVNVVTNVKSLRAARLSVDRHRWLLLLSLLPVVVAFVIMSSIAFRLELLLVLLMLLLLGLFLILIIVGLSIATLPLIFVLIVPILIIPIIRWGLSLLKIIIVIVSTSPSIITLSLLASALILLLLLINTRRLVELAIVTTIISSIYFL